jgi:hypothetical protein
MDLVLLKAKTTGAQAVGAFTGQLSDKDRRIFILNVVLSHQGHTNLVILSPVPGFDPGSAFVSGSS